MADGKTDITDQQVQNLYNKGLTAFERANLDFAIELLMKCVTDAPGFTKARKVLRASQIAKFKREKKSKLALQMQEFSAAMLRMKIRSMKKSGKLEEAMLECEKLLTMNPLNPDNVEVEVEVAEAAGHQDAALFTVEGAYENNPNDMDLLKRVANYYVTTGDFKKAQDAYTKLVVAFPSDLDLVRQLKDVEARLTMASGWDENAGKRGGFVNLIANKEQAKKIDMANKTIVTGTDADALIEEAKQKIAAEPNNLNFYRALARIYSQNRRFQEAVGTLEAARKINSQDPELDRALTQAKISDYEARIDAFKKANDTNNANNLENEMNQFIFNDLMERVNRYPNDLRLRFELGLQYFSNDYFDDAIGQFQLSQRSPKERVESLYYLACCFAKKGQRDMAVMQLETANGQLDVMDDIKKKVVFMLGCLAEEAGDYEKAFGYYKDVYAADIGFEDIGARMERIYKLRQAKSGN